MSPSRNERDVEKERYWEKVVREAALLHARQRVAPARPDSDSAAWRQSAEGFSLRSALPRDQAIGGWLRTPSRPFATHPGNFTQHPKAYIVPFRVTRIHYYT